MINGLDLFSGIGGLTLALAPWVRPVAYCESDRYAQAVLLSAQARGDLPRAPIWDDVRTLRGTDIPPVDIISGGFPCQDLSVAGAGAGLAGERSGLFFEVLRLAKEIKPKFLFLENVPAIRTRGLSVVGKRLADLGYDCRWDIVSAADVGAPHVRKRWWLLAYAPGERRGEGRAEPAGIEGRPEFAGRSSPMAHANGSGSYASAQHGIYREKNNSGPWDGEPERCNFREPSQMADSDSEGLEVRLEGKARELSASFRGGWWATEPDLGRVAHGVPARVERIRGLGNAVVPLAAREAFQRLAGL